MGVSGAPERDVERSEIAVSVEDWRVFDDAVVVADNIEGIIFNDGIAFAAETFSADDERVRLFFAGACGDEFIKS